MAVAAAAHPDGRVVVVEGEAGIGKTRLGEAVADVIRGRGGVVLASRGYPGEAGIAYGPIAHLLRRSGIATTDGPGGLAGLDQTHWRRSVAWSTCRRPCVRMVAQRPTGRARVSACSTPSRMR